MPQRPKRRQRNRQIRTSQKSQNFLADNWDQFVAAMMWKNNITETIITPADFRRSIGMCQVELQLEQRPEGLLMRIVAPESRPSQAAEESPPPESPAEA